jgi:hypothetical protein
VPALPALPHISFTHLRPRRPRPRSGRFISDRGTKNLNLLDALNDPRFLFHSAAPLLSVAGLDMAQVRPPRRARGCPSTGSAPCESRRQRCCPARGPTSPPGHSPPAPQRAGVEWASSPLLAGGVTAAVLAVVGLSTLRNTLLLETK